MLGLISCIFNTIVVSLMAYRIIAYEHMANSVNVLLLLIVVFALVGQWVLTICQRRRNRVWFKVEMVADDCDIAIVSMGKSEYESVKRFIKQVKSQRCALGWVGGHWSISKPYETREEAEGATTEE